MSSFPTFLTKTFLTVIIISTHWYMLWLWYFHILIFILLIFTLCPFLYSYIICNDSKSNVLLNLSFIHFILESRQERKFSSGKSKEFVYLNWKTNWFEFVCTVCQCSEMNIKSFNGLYNFFAWLISQSLRSNKNHHDNTTKEERPEMIWIVTKLPIMHSKFWRKSRVLTSDVGQRQG